VTSPSRVVLHIGGSKTASTSLQNGVFLGAPSVHHFGEFGDGVTTVEEDRIIRSLLEVDDAFLDPSEIGDVFLRHAARAAGGTLIFSSADVLHANQPTQVAHRLAQFAPDDVTVLLVVRNQRSALASYYSGHGAWLKPAPRPYYRAFVEFQDWLDHQWLQLPDSRLRTFAYFEQLRPFIEVFGRDSIRVLCFEDLVCGDRDSWRQMGELVGLEAGEAESLFRAEHQRERISERQLKYGRAMRLLLPLVTTPDVRTIGGRAESLLRGGSKYKPEWTSVELERLDDYYSSGNAELEGVFDLSLRRWEYPGL